MNALRHGVLVDWDNPRPPGDALGEVIVANGLTQTDFAKRCGLSLKHVNRMVKGAAGWSPDVALRFEMVTGVRCSDWLCLQSAWLTRLARPRIEAEWAARQAAEQAALNKPIDLWPVNA